MTWKKPPQAEQTLPFVANRMTEDECVSSGKTPRQMGLRTGECLFDFIALMDWGVGDELLRMK